MLNGDNVVWALNGGCFCFLEVEGVEGDYFVVLAIKGGGVIV